MKPNIKNTSPARRVEELRDVYDLASDYAQVKRATRMPDGSYETDAHHVVSLAFIAGALATKYYPELDVGKVMFACAGHDVVEAVADDESTFGATKESLALKAKREEKGMDVVCNERLKEFPDFAAMLRDVEELSEPEYVFVKLVDKLMPGFTHQANGGRTLIEDYGVNDEVSFWSGVAATDEKMQTYSQQFPEIYEMRQVIHAMTITALKAAWSDA